MARRVWCAIAGQDRLLHVDTTNCSIVYDLRKAAVDLSRIKIPYIRVDIWKVKNPKLFPVSDFASLKRIPNDDDDLRSIAELLYPHKGLGTIFVGDISENDIGIIMKIDSKRSNLPSISVPERRIWCAIAGTNQLHQVDVAKCKDGLGLKKAVARESNLPVDGLDLWKLKEPQRWPLNDKIRKRIPYGKESLGEVADQLTLDPVDVTAMFDDTIRKYSVYLVASVPGKKELYNSQSTSSSTPKRLAWCVTPGGNRLFQLEVERWQTMSELEDAVWRRSGFMRQSCILTKVKNPRLWPINRDTRSIDIPLTEEYIYSISDPLDERTLNALLNDEFDENTLQLILVLLYEYPPPMSSSTSDAEAVSERYFWCAIAGRNQVLRVDASSCEVVSDLRNALISEGRLGLRYDQIMLWKVTEPANWLVEGIVTGGAEVPRLREDLQEIATQLYSDRYVEREFGGELHEDKVYAIMQILDERSSSWSSSASSSAIAKSDPLSDRADIHEALRECGFRNDIFQDLDRNHVGDVFRMDGERFILKYLRPGRCDEIKVLRYLSRFDSPQNHAPIKFIIHELNEGALLLTRHLGSPVFDHPYLCDDLLQIAQQIIEGVAFLHSKLVVHMDLKPSHILIGESTRVWIIDYDLSEILNNENEKVSGYRGTKGYTAPEVGRKAYNPMRADVWAAGKVVQELCGRCPPHEDRKFLIDLSDRLMTRKAEERPTMEEACREVDDYIRSRKAFLSDVY